MEMLVQWATILSPIIAVLLALWASRYSARDTSKQIESVKELAKIQIKTTQLQLKKELLLTTALYKQASKRYDEERDSDWLYNMCSYGDPRQHEEKKRDLHDNQDIYAKQYETLRQIQSQLDVLIKEIGGE